MRNNLTRAFTSLVLATGFFLPTSAMAADYPPAMNYDNLTEFVQVGETDSKMLFASRLYTMNFYLPGRDAQVRIDVVNDKGQIISTKERVHRYKNGEALGKVDSWTNKCKSGACLDGPNTPLLAPGLYWLIFSEHGKIFSAEWFEVRAYSLGEGRFAKGQITYQYLPTTQMAQISLYDGELHVEAGFAGESDVKDQNAVVKEMKATLNYNGTLFAKLPGNNPHRLTLEPYTQMHTLNLSLAKNNSVIKKADMKDGNYELNITLDGKAYRKFKFQLKGGKFVYQGRQKESTRPPERMIVSEKYAWLWNTYVQEPVRTIPAVDLKTAMKAPVASESPNSNPQTTASPTPEPQDLIGDALKKIPKLPF